MAFRPTRRAREEWPVKGVEAAWPAAAWPAAARGEALVQARLAELEP